MSAKIQYIIILFISLLFTSCSQSDFIIQEEKYVTQFKYSPLHTAVMLNNLELVKKVINKNDLEKKDNFNDTALIDSVRNNNTKITKFLICYGANINVKDNNNLTLIDISTRNENTEILSLLKTKDINNYCSSNQNKPNKPIVKKAILTKKEVIIKPQIITKKYDSKYTEIQREIDEINLTDKFIKKDELINEKSLEEEIRHINLNSNITLNKTNLYFNFKSGELNKSMKNDINLFMNQLLSILDANKRKINKLDSIILETYTSSEYRTKKSLEAKRKANKGLSYKRAIKIKLYILNKYSNSSFSRKWLNKIIKINAMGSSSIIYDSNNFEDKEKSKRSIFKVIIK